MFLNSSNNVFTLNKFLKYFVGLSLSSFGISGAIATRGPTWMKSARAATKAATTKVNPI